MLFSVCFVIRLAGQGVCSNTAVTPVFSQTFGTSVTPTTQSTVPVGFTSNYLFGNVGTDGNYIVTPLVQNSGKADWSDGRDHTGDVNGNMFLVNAGGGKSIFCQQTVTGLCPGSVYSFSAWLANLNTPSTVFSCFFSGGYKYSKVTFNIRDELDILIR